MDTFISLIEETSVTATDINADTLNIANDITVGGDIHMQPGHTVDGVDISQMDTDIKAHIADQGAHGATSVNEANKIVRRDELGGFDAGDISVGDIVAEDINCDSLIAEGHSEVKGQLKVPDNLLTEHIYPQVSSLYDLGASNAKFANLYAGVGHLSSLAITGDLSVRNIEPEIDSTYSIGTVRRFVNGRFAGKVAANQLECNRFTSHVIPYSNNYDLGSYIVNWRNIYASGDANLGISKCS